MEIPLDKDLIPNEVKAKFIFNLLTLSQLMDVTCKLSKSIREAITKVYYVEKRGVLSLRFDGKENYNKTNTDYYIKICKGISIKVRRFREYE